MKRILVSLAVLILVSCGVLIIRDLSAGNGLRLTENVIFVLSLSGITFVMAPLGILLLTDIYGAHYLVLGLLSIFGMIFGVAKSKRLYGQVIAVLGVLSWMLLGAYGLGHGG